MAVCDDLINGVNEKYHKWGKGDLYIQIKPMAQILLPGTMHPAL